MKLNCGLTWTEKRDANAEWHRFFAVWPRRVAYRDCRWLETVERRITRHGMGPYSFFKTEYRAL